MAKEKDKFPNIIVKRATQSAANTITFEEIQVGLNLFDRAGLLITRVEYSPSEASLNEMTAEGDVIEMGLTNNDGLSSLLPSDEQVLDVASLQRRDFGTAASAQILERTLQRDFSTLPGGGILVPPKPLYIGIASTGLASAAVADFRIYFVVIRLESSEYLELLETRRAFG